MTPFSLRDSNQRTACARSVRVNPHVCCQSLQSASLSQQHRLRCHRIQGPYHQYPQVPTVSLVPCPTLLDTVPTHSTHDEIQRVATEPDFHQHVFFSSLLFFLFFVDVFSLLFLCYTFLYFSVCFSLVSSLFSLSISLFCVLFFLLIFLFFHLLLSFSLFFFCFFFCFLFLCPFCVSILCVLFVLFVFPFHRFSSCFPLFFLLFSFFSSVFSLCFFSPLLFSRFFHFVHFSLCFYSFKSLFPFF